MKMLMGQDDQCTAALTKPVFYALIEKVKKARLSLFTADILKCYCRKTQIINNVKIVLFQ